MRAISVIQFILWRRYGFSEKPVPSRHRHQVWYSGRVCRKTLEGGWLILKSVGRRKIRDSKIFKMILCTKLCCSFRIMLITGSAIFLVILMSPGLQISTGIPQTLPFSFLCIFTSFVNTVFILHLIFLLLIQYKDDPRAQSFETV
jgi:hypothetical protein